MLISSYQSKPWWVKLPDTCVGGREQVSMVTVKASTCYPVHQGLKEKRHKKQGWEWTNVL